MKTRFIVTCLSLLMGALAAQAADELRTALTNRVDEAKRTVGIVVGTIQAEGRQVIGHGRLAKADPRAPDGDTLFEIGSITKVFTSLLLADMVERGEVKLDDPVAQYLPETVKMPTRGDKQITLRDLSMHVSGLPRLPNNMKPADPGNPYADYDPQKLYAYLARYELTRDPGDKYEYSNLAAGLLGHALSRRAGMSYEQVIRRRVLEPLGMTNTSVTLSERQKQNLAIGHDSGLAPVKNWDLDALAGAGALRSTANDMLTFLAAHMELSDTPLKAAMRRMRSDSRPTETTNLRVALGWHISTQFGMELVWHNGGTGGYHAWAGFDPAKRKGAVVLCNSALDIDDLGQHLVEPQYPLRKWSPPVVRKEITLEPKALQTFVGKYDYGQRKAILTVTEEGGHLFAQLTGQPRFEIFPRSQTEFFWKVVDAEVKFVKDDKGKVIKAIHQQEGGRIDAPRIE